MLAQGLGLRLLLVTKIKGPKSPIIWIKGSKITQTFPKNYNLIIDFCFFKKKKKKNI